MTLEAQPNWMSIKEHVFSEYVITYTPIGINKDNYMVIDGNCIRKYDFESDTWQKLMDNFSNFWYSGCQAAFDSDKCELWIANCDQLAHIKLNKNNELNIFNNLKKFGVRGSCIFVQNTFYVIGGSLNTFVSRWDNSTKQYKDIAKMYGGARLSHFGLIHNESSNSLLLFGGYDYSKSEFMDSILEYNIKQNKWCKLPVSLPTPLWQCACVLAIRRKYVLIFGGEFSSNLYDNTYDEIYVYSVKQQKIRTSKVKCPVKGVFNAVTINDEKQDELLVIGFVRNEWRLSNIEYHYFPPYYLLKLMHSYYLNEFVCLNETEDGGHWKMSTLDII